MLQVASRLGSVPGFRDRSRILHHLLLEKPDPLLMLGDDGVFLEFLLDHRHGDSSLCVFLAPPIPVVGELELGLALSNSA